MTKTYCTFFFWKETTNKPVKVAAAKSLSSMCILLVFLRHLLLEPACPPASPRFCSIPFKVFQTVPPTLTQHPPTLIQYTNLNLHIINGFKQKPKGWFYQSNFFRQLRITFFIKLWWQKNFFIFKCITQFREE